METRLINSKVKEDIAFGQLTMLVTVPDADMKHDVDCSISGFRIAWRRRRPIVTKYSELSIRYERRNGAKTEYQKILDGEANPHLFVFEFPDAYVICSGPAMLKALKDNVGYIGKWNRDGQTKAYYIPIDKIPHLVFKREVVSASSVS